MTPRQEPSWRAMALRISKICLHNQWQTAFQGATNAMVSYLCCFGADGQTHVPVKMRLANRTFVAKDNNGRVIVGTTKGGFLLAHQARRFPEGFFAEPEERLNFDGCPIACQSVRLTGFQ
jgi:hypothetical protein